MIEQEIRDKCKTLHVTIPAEQKELDGLVNTLVAIVGAKLKKGMSQLLHIDSADGFMNLYVVHNQVNIKGDVKLG